MYVCYSHQLFLNVENLLKDGETNDALACYVTNYSQIPSKRTLEKQLLLAVLETEKEITWIEDLIDENRQSVSYRCLVFTVAQVSKTDLESFSLPPVLSAIPSEYLILLAKAWYRYPQCFYLRDSPNRHLFISALQQQPEALGWCVLTLTKLEAFELLQDVSQSWVNYGLYAKDTPYQIKTLCEDKNIEKIKSVIFDSIKFNLNQFNTDKVALLLLLQACFKLIDVYEHPDDIPVLNTLIAYSERLLNFPLSGDMKQQVLVYRFSALAELSYSDAKKGEQLLDEYKTQWQTATWAFPYPEKLLFAFQKLGADDLELHLLSTAEISNDTEKWVQLTSDQILKKRYFDEIMQEWGALYKERSSDERVLIGFTRSLLREDTALWESEWTEKIKEQWLSISHINEHYYHVSHSYLVQIQASDSEKVSWFEEYLYDASLTNITIYKTVEVYLRALSNRRNWSRIKDYIERDHADRISLIISFSEYAFMIAMAKIDELPKDDKKIKDWYPLWEEIISLPLKKTELLDAVHLFNHIKEEKLRKHMLGEKILNSRLYGDIELQVLRHAKAYGERLIEQYQSSMSFDRVISLKQQLKKCEISNIGNCLENI